MRARVIQFSQRCGGLMAYVAGALMAAGFAPYHCWPVVFVSLPAFYLLLINSNSRKQTLWRGFFFGYGYSMAGTWWIANALLVDADKFAWMLPFSVLGLSAVMALYFVVLAYLVYKLRARMNILLFAVLWVAVEYLRSIGIFGFPWNLAGYIGLASLTFAQMASVIGTFGLSLLVVGFGVLPVCWLQGEKRVAVRASILALFVFAGCIGYGVVQLRTVAQPSKTTLRLVQPSIPQSVKWTKDGLTLARQVLASLSNQGAAENRPPITIWPETAYPMTLRVGQPYPLPTGVSLLLTGALRAEGYNPTTRIWNALAAMDSDGGILATYDKHQLVPFGEFVPLRSVLPLDKITPGDLDFTRGEGPQTLKINGVPAFSPLICYEVIFPWLAVNRTQRPEWMLNVTNDAWYGNSPGPYQHFDAARMRSIEQGLPLVRVANNGISAMIDIRGRVIAAMPLNQRGVLDVPLMAPGKTTIYADLGEKVAVLLLFSIGFFAAIANKSRKK